MEIVEKHILIIEDNEQNLYMMQFLLEYHGFTVTTACDGSSGIATALRIQPDAILLDIQLPERDGYEVLAELRNYTQLVGIPIIVVTSYAMVGDRERILAAGASGYLEKPIDPERFAQQVSAYLQPAA